MVVRKGREEGREEGDSELDKREKGSASHDGTRSGEGRRCNLSLPLLLLHS